MHLCNIDTQYRVEMCGVCHMYVYKCTHARVCARVYVGIRYVEVGGSSNITAQTEKQKTH
jgi:hypothetical protein